MKIIESSEPGFSTKTFGAMLAGSMYNPDLFSPPLPVAGILLACGEEAEDVMVKCLAARHMGGLLIHCQEINEPQWRSIFATIGAGTAELVLTALVLISIEKSPTWLVTELERLCDGERPCTMMLATTDDYQAVAPSMRTRLLAYLGLSKGGHMMFALPALVAQD